MLAKLLKIFKRILLGHNLRYTVDVLSKLDGVYPRECPICGYRGMLRAFGHPPRYDCLCPGCKSIDRDRYFKLVLDRHQLIPAAAKVLHFAPEPVIARILKEGRRHYQSADLMRQDVDLNLNMEKIDLPDGSVDAVVAHHVLEHVNDDKALAEIRRILAPGGRFFCMVPLVYGWEHSYENDQVQTEADRDLHFGQSDHVWYYGRDIKERMAKHFQVHEYTAGPEDCVRYGLDRGEKLWVLEK